MAHRKRDSKVLRDSKKRAASMRSVDPKLQFEADVSLKLFDSAIAGLESELSTYNRLLSDLDASLARVESKESGVAALSKRMLSGVATRFGVDSPEYAQAGGTRTVDRKRPGQRKKEQSARKRPHHRGEVVVMPQAIAPSSPVNGVAIRTSPQ